MSLYNIAKVHRRLFGIAFAALSPELHFTGRRRRRRGGGGGIKQSRLSSLYRQITSKALRHRCCPALSLFSLSLPFAGGGGGGDKVACFAVMYANCIEGSSVSLSRRFRLFFS